MDAHLLKEKQMVYGDLDLANIKKKNPLLTWKFKGQYELNVSKKVVDMLMYLTICLISKIKLL